MNAITRSFTGRKRIRKSFGRIPEVAPMPNLIDVQRSSYEAFLQMNVRPDNRTHSGLQEVFKSVFPIDDFAGRGRLEFVQERARGGEKNNSAGSKHPRGVRRA